MKRKIRLKSNLCPGDITMLTAAVRDLHKAHGDKFDIAVDTSCMELWENNPYVTTFTHGDVVEEIPVHYDLIEHANQWAYHFIHGYPMFLEERLGVRIPVTEFKGDIHISEAEKSWMSQVQEMGVWKPFWVILAGGKRDYTAKWWNPEYYQEVINHFRGKIIFVQCGENNTDHWHPPLKGVINLVGKTDLRQFVRLIYHSSGVVCPVTSAMHLAAAVPVKEGNPPIRPCVVISGGREPSHWEKYNGHRFLENVGSMPCSQNGGCWKSRCQTMNDKDEKDKDLCEFPIDVNSKLRIPRCMDMIRPADVIEAIESYFLGGTLRYINGPVPLPQTKRSFKPPTPPQPTETPTARKIAVTQRAIC
jgi:ADP-heptose:LPS heptosyltransferase